MSKKMMRRACAALCVMGIAALAGCAPQSAAPAEESAYGPTANDVVVESQEYDTYDPAAEAEITGGTAIEGSEEEQLQQERIAGGAVGAVNSKNLEPVEGVVDGTPNAYVPSFGAEEAAEVVHGDASGTMCTTCHSEDLQGGATPMPQSHIGQNLADDDCVTCHEI